MKLLATILKEIDPHTKGLTGLNSDEYETDTEKNFAGHHAGDMYMGYMGSPSDKDTVDFDDGDVDHEPEIYDPKKDKINRGYEPVKNISEMNLTKIIKELENPCWKGYEMVGMKNKNGKEVPNCVPVKENDQPGGYWGDDATEEDINSDADVNYGSVEPEEYDVENYDDIVDFIKFMRNYDKSLNEGCQCLREAEYQGRSVQLGKPMQGDVKKFKVYVKNPAGNVVKVNFGQKGMVIKKNNPERRKSFRARMNCDNPGPRTGARYWSCRKW
jgi:hypothetical protein